MAGWRPGSTTSLGHRLAPRSLSSVSMPRSACRRFTRSDTVRRNPYREFRETICASRAGVDEFRTMAVAGECEAIASS